MVQTYHTMTPLLVNSTDETIQELMESMPIGFTMLQVAQGVSVDIGMPALNTYLIIFIRYSSSHGVALAIPYSRNASTLYKTSMVNGEWGEWLTV